MSKAILIVEDEEIVARDLAKKLRQLGYEIAATTATGTEAVALAHERHPDLVLMDIRLPGSLDGVQAAEIIRRECDLPVVYLTAHSDRATMDRAKLTQPFGYLLKPFSEREIEAHIEIALYKHQAEREVRQQREWLRVTLQSIGDAVITTDAEGKVTSLNPVAEELTGWKMAEALGCAIEKVFNIVNEETRRPAANPVERVLREGKVVGLANHTAVISRDGRQRAIEDSAAPIKDAQGRIIGVVMVFHDVTGKRQAGEKQAWLASFPELNPAPIVEVDLASESIVYQNFTAKRLLPDLPTIGLEHVWLAGAQSIAEELRQTGAPLAHREVAVPGGGYYHQSLNLALNGQRLRIYSFEITERKQAEEALRESEERLRFALETCHIGAWDLDIAGHTAFRSLEHDRLFGYAELLPHWTYEQFLEHVLAEDRAAVDAKFRQATSERRDWSFECRIRRADGQIRWIWAAGRHRTEAGGGVCRMAGIVQDITERKEAEERLKTSGRLYRAIGESIDYGIWICDAQGRNTYASESFLKLVGITQGQCSEFGWGDVLHPDDAEATIAAWKQCVQSGGPWYREHRYRGADGEWHPILACGVAVRDERDQITHWAGINLDISRLKQAEEALRQSEQRFRILADSTPVMIWVHEAVSGLRFVNRAYRDFFGVSFEDVEGSGWQPLLHPEDVPGYVEVFKKCHAERREFQAQARVRRHDGQWRWIESFGAPRFSSTGEFMGMAGSSVDITERKEAEAVLARSKEELENLVKERTAKLHELVQDLEHFSYTITHDMRAPLRAMRGFAEMAREYCAEKPDKELQDCLRRICTGADRMDNLITDALSYKKAVRQELVLEPVDLNALLRGMLDTYPEFQESRAHIHVERALPQVMGNVAGLTQCFSNLLGNAIKFAKPSQIPEVRIWAEQKDGCVYIWVEDDGIGIPEDFQPHVFEMFSRGQRTQQGTGIGLALVRKVTERMGGKAGVKSVEGQGSQFWLKLNPAL